MPTFSEITVEFDREFQEKAILDITYSKDKIVQNLMFTWVNTRVSSNEVEVGTPTANLGETSAINFKTAFDLDYPTGYVTSIVDTNKILIQSEDKKIEFLNVVIIHHDRSDIPDTPDTPDTPITIINYLDNVDEHKIKYYINYCDDFGTNRNVFILKKGHVEGATELLADINPISISYDSSDDFKFSPIRPSLAEVYLIFNSEGDVDFEDFWTADEKEYQIQDVKDGNLEWIGHVVAGGFEYEFKGGLYYASLKAIDGLSTLEALTFVDDNQKPYGNQDLVYNNNFEFPFSLIITEILKKLQLDLDLWSCVDSYERTMLKTGDVREADPLSAAYVNVKTYIKYLEDKKTPYWYGSGEEWNCQEVLENVLYIFGAKLYQEKGTWRIKTINSDIDYGTGDTQKYWRKYNTVGTYLGNYEVVNDLVNIPCGSMSKLMVGNDHVMSMDDVYKAFRMNYEYTFVRDGDSPIDLVYNGSFCSFVNESKLAAPEGWYRWVRDRKWHIRIKDITIPFDDAGGNTCGIEIGTQKTGLPTTKTDPNPAIWTSLANNVKRPSSRISRTGDRAETSGVLKGDSIMLEIWNKFKQLSSDRTVSYAPMYRMILFGDSNDYYLRNSKEGLIWERIEYLNADLEQAYFFYFTGSSLVSTASYTNYGWHHYSTEIEKAPENGVLMFHIHGLAASTGRDSDNFPAFKSFTASSTRGSINPDYKLTKKWRVVRENWIDEGGDIPRLQITGFQIGYIPNESELPKQQDYIYKNENKNYTLQVDPVTIFNGDTQDKKHISNIIVPTNTDGSKNFWDDISDSYGSSSLGLLTVREIMRQYQKPYRIFEGTIKVQDARFGSVYTFDVIPDVRFILQRGTFNKQKQYIEDATFVELSKDLLPNGGTEGGNTLDAEWENTGNNYCEIGDDALNTGYVIIEQVDINPNSETYQETREILSDDQDTLTCPLSTPRLYYWNTDDIYLDLTELKFSPFTSISDNEIQINMNNDEGNYLYLVHLKSIGVVEKIYTPTSPSNVLSDWVYLDDVTIDGYIYRVLRTDYVMTEFTDFTHNFKFN